MSDVRKATSARRSSAEFDRTVLTTPDTQTAQTTDTPQPGNAAAGVTAFMQPRVRTPARATIEPSLPGIPAEIVHDILHCLHVVDIVVLGMACRKLQKRAEAYLRRPPAMPGRQAQYLEVTRHILVNAQAALKWGGVLAQSTILPTQDAAQACLQAHRAQLSGKASLIAAAVGRRFHDVAITLDKNYAPEVGNPLVQAGGWTCLNLHVSHTGQLGPFLWHLIQAQSEAALRAQAQAQAQADADADADAEKPPGPQEQEDAPSRKLNIVMDKALMGEPLPHETAVLLSGLPTANVDLQLTGLALQDAQLRHFLPVIAANKTLEHLELRSLVDAKALSGLYPLLAGCPGLKTLSLHFLIVPTDHDLATLVKQVGLLKIESFYLGMKVLMSEPATCLAGLVANPMRKLVLDGMSFKGGVLAGLGDTLAKSTTLESLAFYDCKFWHVDEWTALLAGVAASGSLSQLSVTGCKLSGTLLTEDLLHAAQQCTSLKELSLNQAYADKYPDALARLRAARPGLGISLVPGRPYLNAGLEEVIHREGADEDGSSSTDDDSWESISDPASHESED